ncbi:YrhK family protein [Pseudalkalibacillus caeni]|uniref:YrhK domain-containing protein n=1 Tax=Exobacillus caeni TaxID=2574798 RepID=A0A5R9FB72_9BACL|nr:YrhK family protein [Pseudalkalibacillus caeni]TLS38918.1 hypothetical protein FCL54_00990 [Pseudalkalibacillus caeni]
MSKRKERPDIEINVGGHEIVITKRYALLANLNDILIGLWFLIGSILFLWKTTHQIGVYFFIVGSAQLLIRPLIRIVRNIHLKRINPDYESSY